MWPVGAKVLVTIYYLLRCHVLSLVEWHAQLILLLEKLMLEVAC